ncbi:MAG TPA: T9SS type A sorting domain-containing protein [Flavobacterium sp.]|jgi:hypothetical protein
MKIFYILPVLFTCFGLHAQVASSAVSQGDLHFQAGTIYIEMNIPSAKTVQTKTVEEGLRISPNPVTDFLYFLGEETISKATVYDMGGRKIMECALVNNRVDLSPLLRGSYIIVSEGTSSQGHVFLKK